MNFQNLHVESLCISTGFLVVRGKTKGANISRCEVGLFILVAGEWARNELYSCCRMNGVEAGGHKVDTIVSRVTHVWTLKSVLLLWVEGMHLR